MLTKNLHKGLISLIGEQTTGFMKPKLYQDRSKTCFYQCKKLSSNRNTSKLHQSKLLDSFGVHKQLQQQQSPVYTSCMCGTNSKGNKEKFDYSKSHPKSVKHIYSLKQKIKSTENAKFFISHLSKAEQRFLLQALNATDDSSNGNANGESNGVSKRQLRLVFLHNFVPFVGFGFLDNAIMILAGECIDLTIGVTLGISTMAAAALGNTVSDIAGIGLAGSVEMLFLRIGLPVPALTPEQAEQRSTVISSNMGKAVGIVLGCLVGMFPLLFLEDKEEGKVNEV